MSGDATSAMTTGMTDPHFTASTPYATTPIPTSAPMSACDELDGSPRRQVIRFQMIAPISAAMIMPSAHAVLRRHQPADGVGHVRMQDLDGDQRADEVEDRRQTRPRCAGPSARVLIEVATALAVSWNPLVKSNPSAITTVTISSASMPVTRS